MQGGVSGRELLYELFNLMGLFVPVRSWGVVWVKACIAFVQADACLAIGVQAGNVSVRCYITIAMPWIKGGKADLIHGRVGWSDMFQHS